MYFDKVYYDENNKPTEVLIICDKCGKILSIKDVSKFQIIKSDYCVIKDNTNISCDNCTNIGRGIVQYKKPININHTTVNKSNSTSYIPKCPTCGSQNIEKISVTKKAFGGAMFGFFSSDVRNTMHCKNCGYKW